MSSASPHSPDEIEQAAATWAVRLDRGLSAAEQDEYSHWLAEDARHGEAMARMRWGWEELDRLAGANATSLSTPDPDLLAPGRRASRPRAIVLRFAPVVLAAAAVLVALLYFRGAPAPAPTAIAATTAAKASLAPCERRVLDDGSVVDLNRGAEIVVDYTPSVRRVRLVHGEANFTVAKNPARPFIVDASGVFVQAVGTVFNVRMAPSAVEVLVSEGKVKVNRAAAASANPPLVVAGQRAVVPVSSNGVPDVATLTPEEMAAQLAWQPRVLDFTDAPLPEIVAEFNAHNTVHVVVGDSALASVRLTAVFRSDNLEGFVRLMQSDFGMRAEWRNDRELVLLKK